MNDEAEARKKLSLKLKDDDESLKLVDGMYIKKLSQVPGDQEYPVLEFARNNEIPNYNPKQGYGFYQFTQPEFISYSKLVILQDKVCKHVYWIVLYSPKTEIKWYISACTDHASL